MSGRQEMLQKEYEERRARFVEGGASITPPRNPPPRRVNWVPVLLVLILLALLAALGVAAWWCPRDGKCLGGTDAADGTPPQEAAVAAVPAVAAADLAKEEVDVRQNEALADSLGISNP